MAIITISRGSRSRGAEVARLVAERLGYRCVAREVLLEASEHFNAPEFQLVRAIHDSPSLLERFSHGKEKYLSYIRASLLNTLKEDDVVYHGLGGHFYVSGVSHVLKVRIQAEWEDRVQVVMERDGVARAAAEATLKKDDAERVKWAQHVHGVDPCNPALYDLIVHVHKLTTKDAADLICRCASLPQLQATPTSRQRIADLALAAEVQAMLYDIRRDLDVTASAGVVTVTVRAPLMQMDTVSRQIESTARSVAGVDQVVLVPEFVTTLD